MAVLAPELPSVSPSLPCSVQSLSDPVNGRIWFLVATGAPSSLRKSARRSLRHQFSGLVPPSWSQKSW